MRSRLSILSKTTLGGFKVSHNRHMYRPFRPARFLNDFAPGSAGSL